MTTTQLQSIIDQLHHAQVAYIITVSPTDTTSSIFSDLPKDQAVNVIAEAMDRLLEDELQDEQAPKVLMTFMGYTEEHNLQLN